MTAGTFWSVLRCDFVHYDDDKYITENAFVQGGLTARSALQAFTRPHYHIWHPLTTLSYLLDYELAGLEPLWYHLVNLLFHTANVVLVLLVFSRLTGAVWPAAFVAAVFAVHPLQVDTVAWIAERKNVLSCFFWLLTMWAYACYAEEPGPKRYLLVMLCLCLGLMSKPTVVTLPFVLLLLDYWPLNRIGPRGEQEQTGRPIEAARRRHCWARLVAEKVPMLIPAAGLCVITYLAQQAGGVLAAPDRVPLRFRLANAAISYLTYIEKLLWPSGLAVFYPHPGADFSVPRLIVSIIVLLVVSVLCLYFARSRRYLLVGWLWYLGTLVPVIGIVQAGAQARADRYMYVTMIGLLVIVAWGLKDLLGKAAVPRLIPAVGSAVVLAAAMVCSTLQLRHWRNGLALFKRAIEVTENNYICQNNYANRLSDAGQNDLAIRHYRQCLQIRPDLPEVHNNLGNALADMDQLDEAIVHYRKAIELALAQERGKYPPRGLAEAYHNLGNALKRKGEFTWAAENYKASLELRADNVDTLYALGQTYDRMKQYDEAIGCYRRILELQPGHVFAAGMLGLALANKGDIDGAVEQCRYVLTKRPYDVEMRCNLGILLQRQNKLSEAIEQFRWALQIDPQNAKARQLLDAAEQKRKNP